VQAEAAVVTGDVMGAALPSGWLPRRGGRGGQDDAATEGGNGGGTHEQAE